MANSIDTFITDSANKQLKTALEELKRIHQEIIEINKQGVSFGRGGNTGIGTRGNASELNALERERLRILKALETSQARLNLANDANTQALARTRTELRTLNSAYLQLSQRQNEAARRVQDLIARGRLATQTQRQYNQELKNAQKEFNTLNQKVLQADQAVGRFNRNVGNYPKQAVLGIRNLLGAFGIVGGVNLIASITKDIFEQTKQINSLDNALKAVTETQDNFANQQEFINRITEQYGLSLLDTTKTFTSFYASAKEKLSNNELQQVFEDIAKSASVLGLSIEQQEGAFRALEQMLSKGNVQAEEIRGQLGERLPGAFNILAKSMGVTTQELNKLLKDGKVLADEVLPKFAREYAKSVGADQVTRVETLVSAQNRLSSSWTAFIRELNEGEGVITKVFSSLLNGINGAIGGLKLLIQSEESRDKDTQNKARANAYQQELDFLESLGDNQRDLAESDKERDFQRLVSLKNEINALIERNKLIKEALASNKTSIFDRGSLTDELLANQEAIKGNNILLAIREGRLKAIEKVLNDLEPEEKKSIELTKEQLRAIEEQNKALYNLNRTKLEIELFVLKQIVDDEERYFTVRLEAQDKYRKKENEIIALAYKEQLRLAKGNQTLQAQALADYQLASLKAIETNAKKVQELQDLQLKPKGIIELSSANNDLAESAKNATDELEKQLENLKKLEEYYKSLKDATNEFIKSFSEGFLADAGLGSLEKFFDGTFERLLAGAEDFGQEFGVVFLSITEAAQEAFNFVNKLQESQTEAQLGRLQKEKDTALQFAGESASAREEIERQYDERRRDIQRRAAEQHKQNAIFNILINTAQGIVSALASTPPNVPLSIAIGAIGAVQAGIVASQQIPEFWKGTDNAPRGWALVDEKRPEVHTDSKGNIKSFGSEKGANFRYLNRGDKIYKSREEYFNRELHNILKDNGISFHNEMAKSGILSNIPSIEKGITAQELESVIRRTQPKNEPSSQFRIKKTDVKQFWKDMLTETENKNNRYSSRGKKV